MPSLADFKTRQNGLSALGLLLVILIVILTAGGAYYYFKKGNSGQILKRDEISRASDAINKGIEESGSSANLSNPASEYCIKVGGELQSQTRGDGGEYSLCNFPDNQSCEEWALYKRQCPLGGIKTIGFDTKEEAYCALIGGKTTAEPNANCTLPDGKICSNFDLYNGKCQ